MTRKRIKLGDVFAIPLPNNKFAFCRKFREACIAIYKYIGDSIDDLPKTEDYQFILGVYDDVLKSGQWPLVGNRPFANDEESWPPPMCMFDKFSKEYSLYHKGEIKKSNKEECKGLEIVAVWDSNHIIDRIMGNDIWEKSINADRDNNEK